MKINACKSKKEVNRMHVINKKDDVIIFINQILLCIMIDGAAIIDGHSRNIRRDRETSSSC